MLMDACDDANDVSDECSVTRMMLVLIFSNELAITMTIVAIEIIMITMITRWYQTLT